MVRVQQRHVHTDDSRLEGRVPHAETRIHEVHRISRAGGDFERQVRLGIDDDDASLERHESQGLSVRFLSLLTTDR